MNNVKLDEENFLQTTMLPDELIWRDTVFDTAWNLHPAKRHVVKIFGRLVEVPRWQQAYGATYRYTGSSNDALPVPLEFVALLTHVQQEIDDRLNGILLNWYEGGDDYIGPHHDDTRDLVEDTPIVTVSYGEARKFRLTRGKGKEKFTVDQVADVGRVFVMPWGTNLAWKHSVPKSKRYSGRRISVTFRAFSGGVLDGAAYFA